MGRKDRLERNDYSKNYQKNRFNSRRLKLLEFLGGKCVICGSEEKLEFDHIEPSTKSFSITRKMNTNWDLLLQEAAKCQILCYACHKLKTGYASHGSHSKYKREGCRCDACRKFMSDYYKNKKSI